jgi:hypothetical protein
MTRSTWFRFCLAAGVLGSGLSGLAAQTSEGVDVSSYPPEIQNDYHIFVDRCTRCHDLSRPLSAKYSTGAQWRAVVARMAGKSGAAISPKDQATIIRFLVYRQQAPARSTTPSVGDGTVTPPSATGAAPSALTAQVPSPPSAAPDGGAPARSAGATESGGLRVEVDAMPAQPIVALVDGHWTAQAPGAGENLFLSVRLFDATTGEKVPYATIRARVGGDGALPPKPLQPLFGAKGFQYGGNFVAPPGDLEVTLEVEPPPLARVNDDGHRWTSPLNLKLNLHAR